MSAGAAELTPNLNFNLYETQSLALDITSPSAIVVLFRALETVELRTAYIGCAAREIIATNSGGGETGDWMTSPERSTSWSTRVVRASTS